MGDLVQREHPENWDEIGGGVTQERKKPAVSETVQDRTKVTITD